MVKYYYDGATRVAMRTGSTLNWLFGDHLGSTSRAANSDGTPLTNGEQRYKPWGEKRFPTGDSALPTTYRFTGQKQEKSLGGGDGLYFYGARWLDPALGRFVSPDTVFPVQSQGVQAWDRYAYANNNAVKYTDPTGHMSSMCGVNECGGENWDLTDPAQKEAFEKSVDDYQKKHPQASNVKKLNNDQVGNGLSDISNYGSVAWSFIQGLDKLAPSPGFAFITGIYSQGFKDADMENRFEAFTRGLVAGVENVGNDYLSTVVGATSGAAAVAAGATVGVSETGVGAFFLGGGGYVVGALLTGNVVDNALNNFNNQIIFPIINSWLN